MTWAILSGFAIGAIPSADLIARLFRIDLRRSGSGNPGTANALRIGGKRVAATVLLFDLAKGASAAALGWALDGEATAVAAGLSAILGQVRNPLFRFHGGKGLGVAGGATLALWPIGVVVFAPVAATFARWHRAAIGALVGLAAIGIAAVLWAANQWDTAWGVMADDSLVWYAIGVILITSPKFINDIGRPEPPPGNRGAPASHPPTI